MSAHARECGSVYATGDLLAPCGFKWPFITTGHLCALPEGHPTPHECGCGVTVDADEEDVECQSCFGRPIREVGDGPYDTWAVVPCPNPDCPEKRRKRAS